MRMSFQGKPTPASSRLATSAVALMMVLAGLLTMTIAAPPVAAAEETNTVGPKVTVAEFRDEDDDGYLETLDVTFQLDGDDEPLVLATVRPTDFTVEVDAQTSIKPHGCRTTSTAPVHCSGIASQDAEGNQLVTFQFFFDELDRLDGSAAPDLTYNGGAYDTGKDRADAVAPGAGTGGIGEVAFATPHFLRAFGSTDSTTVLYWFTEPVHVVPSSVGPDRAAMDSFCWAPDGDPDAEGGITITQATFQTTVPTATVTLSDPPDDGTNGGGPDEATIYQATRNVVTGAQTGACDDVTRLGDQNVFVRNRDDRLVFNAPIRLVGAFGSIDSRELVLTFDGPVAAPGGGEITLEVANDALDYRSNNGGGATNFVGVKHTPGSSRLSLTLNAPLSETDLSGSNRDAIASTPEVADQLIGAGSQIFGAKSIKLEAGNRLLSGAPDPFDKDVVDRWDDVDVAPRFKEAGTADLDGDGVLDAVRVAFDQPVAIDGSPVFSIHQVDLDVATALSVESVVGGDSGVCAVDDGTGTSTTVDHPVGGKTNEVWVCLDETAGAVGTGVRPQVSFNGQGIVDSFGNAAVGFAGMASMDEAAPVALSAETVDLLPASPRPDGRIDGIRVTASEPVASSSFDPLAFTVTHTEGSATYTYEVTTGIDVTGDDFTLPLTARDTGTGGDSGVRPKVVFAPDTVEGHTRLTDAAGNPLPDFTFEQTETTDGAPPRLVRVQGTVDSNTLTAIFSEPVFDDLGGALGDGDFSYTDNNAGDGATGINRVQTTGDDARWTLLLTGSLKDGDVGANGDRVRVPANSIFDESGLPAPSLSAVIQTADAMQLSEVRTRDYFDFSDGTASATAPRRSNGLIDTLELVFVSDVDAGYEDQGTTATADDACVNLEPAEWKVHHESQELTPAFMETYVPAPRERPVSGWVAGECRDPTGVRNGKVVFLIFDETHAWGTGVEPKLDHLGDQDGDGRVLTGVDTGDFPSRDLIGTEDRAHPVLISVSGSAENTQLTLTFSEKVRGTGTDGRIRSVDLQYLDRNPGFATGFASVTSAGGGVTTITATTNQKLNANDLGDTGDAIRPAYDPDPSLQHPTASAIRDLSVWAGFPSGQPIVYKDFTGTSAKDLVARVRDLSEPFVTAYRTEDRNNDGFLDRVALTFNEEVRAGSGGNCVDPEQWSLTLDGGSVDVLRVTDSDTLGTACTDTPSTTLYVEFDGYAVGANTASTPTVSYALPPAGEPAVVDSDGNRLQVLTDQSTADGAPPVLLRLNGCPAGPVTDSEDPCHTGSATDVKGEVETVDRNGDGVIDALRVRFSEPVEPDSVEDRQKDWLVDGDRDAVEEVIVTGSVALIRLVVADDAEPDTSVIPTLAYDPDNNPDNDEDSDEVPGVEDLAPEPNKLSASRYKGTSPGHVVRDGAPPVIVFDEDALDETTLTLTFSEDVVNNDAVAQRTNGEPIAGDSIGSDHIDYLNGNGGSSDDDSSGRSGVTHDATSATAAHVVVVELDDEPTDDDIANDRLRLLSVFDHVGNRISASQARLTGEVDDQEAPAKINNLRATATATDAGNEILLTWTNPPENSQGDDDLDRLVISIDDPNDNKPQEDITVSTISSKATPPNPVADRSQQLKVTGVTSGKTYRFTILAVDDAGNHGLPSEAASVRVPFLDTNAPGAVTDLAASDPTGNSVTLTWTAPGDKNGEDQDVKVAGYQVRVHTSAITDFSQGTLVPANSITFSPSNLAAAGATQTAVVAGLDAEKTYHFAVRAVDLRPNAGGFDTVTATTGPADATPPVGTLAVVSSTHPAATPTENDAPTFTWSGLTDAESQITYAYALSRSSSYDVTGNEEETDLTGSTTALSKGFTDVAPGTWYFHVRGVSQGGPGDAASYQIIVLDPDAVVVPVEDQAAANEALQESVTVTRDGDDNVVRWTLPDTDEPVAGVQIWRSTSPFELLVDLDTDDDAFEDSEYVDEDAPENATYVVTLYFSKDPTGGQVEALAEAAHYTGLTDEELAERGTAVSYPPNNVPDPGDGLPAWLWLLIAVGLLGLVAAVVVPVAVTRRKRDSAGWDEPAQWDDTWSDPAAGDAPDLDEGGDAHGETEHYVECPKCDHGFDVYGEKPVETTCPNCGVRGILR